MQRVIEKIPQRAVEYLSRGADMKIDESFKKILDEAVRSRGIQQVIPLKDGQLGGQKSYVAEDDIFGRMEVVQDCIVVRM